MSFLNSSMRHSATLLLTILSLAPFNLHAKAPLNYYDVIEITIEFDEPVQKELYAMSRSERKARKKIKKHKESEGLDILVAEHEAIVRENAENLLQLVAYFGWPNNHMVGEMGVRAAFQIFDKTPPDLQRVSLPYFDPILQKELLAIDNVGDEKSLSRLRDIVARFGWPGPVVVGTKASVKAFAILQMSPLATKKEWWPILVKEYKDGFLSGERMAMLTDSILVEEGNKQMYGTQVTIENGKVVVSPIAEEATLDQRRDSVGLMSMDDYLVTYADLYLTN